MDNQIYLGATSRVQTGYIVSEGKKRGSARMVREDADPDRYVKVVGVRPEIGILTDNWHSNVVFQNTRRNFFEQTFNLRTLEAWGAQVESDDRAYYVAGGRVWILDLEPVAAGADPTVTGAPTAAASRAPSANAG